MTAQTKGVDVPPSLRGKDIADMTAVELQSVVYAQRDAFAELVAADREHDAARTALEDLNRRIAESGWIDIEFDALRKAGSRFAGARTRRAAALDRVGGPQ